MIDTVQLILVFVIVVLTLLLVVLGIQVYFILKDLRKTITKANRVLDNAGTITENVTGPVETLAGLITSLKAGSAVTVVKVIKSILSKDRDTRYESRSRAESGEVRYKREEY
jgi:hypothetical protein